MPVILDATELPEAPYWVIAQDVFMSGWGDAKGKTNVVLVACDDLDEALDVLAYAKSRGDMTGIRVTPDRPVLAENVLYSLMTKATARRWYQGIKP